MRIAEARLAVGERPAVGRHHLAARRLEHALARGGVPFVGRPEARIDVGLAFGDQAEFQRRSDGEIVALARSFGEIVRGGLIEMRLGGDRDELFAGLAGADRAAVSSRPGR